MSAAERPTVSAADRIFRLTFGGMLALAVITISLLLGGMAAYVDGPAYVRWVFTTPEGHTFASQVGASLRLSFVTSITTTFLSLIIGIPAAYALSRFKYPLPLLVDTILDLPIVLPPLVAGVALLTVMRYWLGPLFDALGVQVHYTARGIVLAQLSSRRRLRCGRSRRPSMTSRRATRRSPAPSAVRPSRRFATSGCPWRGMVSWAAPS
jgi:ABC-type sulfate transport system permease component